VANRLFYGIDFFFAGKTVVLRPSDFFLGGGPFSEKKRRLRRYSLLGFTFYGCPLGEIVRNHCPLRIGYWCSGLMALPLFAIAALVRLLVSPFLWPCIHIFVPSAHTSFHVLRQGSWLVRSNGLACCRGSITAASPRHQIESPKRPTKESAQGRLPQSNLPQ
jgi:hypothetical protein